MKKQIAVLMAAATVVSAVAPVVANADTATDAKIVDWVSKAKKALDEKYSPAATGIASIALEDNTEDYLKSKNVVLVQTDVAEIANEGVVAFAGSAYDGKVTVPAELLDGTVARGVYVVKDSENLQKFLESVAQKGGGAKLAIFDKGVNGEYPFSVSKKAKYVNFSEEAVKTAFENALAAVEGKSVVYKDINGNKLSEVSELAYTATITFKNDATQTVKLGDDQLDFTKYLDKNGNPLDTSDVNWKKFVAKFDVAEDLENETRYDLPQTLGKVEVLNSATVVAKDAASVYTSENGFTEAGKDFVEAFRAFNKERLADRKAYNHTNNTSYKLVGDQLDRDDAIVTKVGDDYYLVIDAGSVDVNDTHRTTTLEFRVKGKSQADLVTLKNYLFSDAEIVVGKFNRLVGSDRYQTAIEVSKKRFKEDGSADSVVIVGGNALLDGLSAAPLAAATNSSVLLASPRTGLSQASLDEISRATEKKLVKKTVYVIGGTDSVPASVDKVLAEKFGAVVIRIAGADRYETSKKIGERLVYDKKVDTNNGKIFYVGGNGAADAMSVAPVAAKLNNGKVSPILVIKKSGIDQQTRNFIIDKLGAGKGQSNPVVRNYVIGGNNSVSTEVYKELNNIANLGKKNAAHPAGIVRLSGDDRYATNVTILKTFYSPANVSGLVVASGANNALVDAQTAGEFAARMNAPILLAGNKLTDAQVELISSNKNAGVFFTEGKLPRGFKGNVYQVGGAVSSDAMKVVVDKLGLTDVLANPVEVQ